MAGSLKRLALGVVFRAASVRSWGPVSDAN